MRIDVEELLAVVSLWPLSERQLEEIRSIATSEPLADGAWLTRFYGPRPGRVERLEQEFARACGVKHAIAVNSGTSALIAALAALGIGPGDDVIVPAYTFIATASAVLMVGAVPNVVDIDESLTIDLEDVKRRITPRTRAIVPVHMRGRPACMDALLAIAREHGLRIVEDTAQACGGTYGGRWLGTFGDVGCFSFGQAKIVNAGEGGMVVTNDDGIAVRVRSYHDTAACWRPNRFAPARMPGELFPGENYRMSELHGAVALSQLEKLNGYLTEHRVYRAALMRCLSPELIEPLAIAPEHDAAGDVAEWLVLLAPTAACAVAITRLLRARGLHSACMGHGPAIRDWHVSRFWEHIFDRSTANRTGHPYTSYPMDTITYSRDACVRTTEILERAILLHLPTLAAAVPPEAVWGHLHSVVQESHAYGG